MAQRRRSTRTAGGAGNEIVVVTAAPAPVRRAPARRRRSSPKRRRSRSGGGGGSSSIQSRLQRTAMGGFGYGFIRKNFPDLPTLPLVGRAGTVALAVYFMKPKSQLLQDIGIAAAAIAGASFGETGVVSGGDAEDEVLQG